jgi:hypothetical protein
MEKMALIRLVDVAEVGKMNGHQRFPAVMIRTVSTGRPMMSAEGAGHGRLPGLGENREQMETRFSSAAASPSFTPPSAGQMGGPRPAPADR